jgi:hypothetical protein
MTPPMAPNTHHGVLQCWCICGRRNVIPDDTVSFVCECGRASEVDWRAEIEGRKESNR